MTNWKKLLTGTLLATSLLAGTSFAAFAAGDGANGPAVEQHGKKHEHAEKHIKLTEEQKQTLTAAGVDFKALRATHEQIHESMKAIRADKETLKSLVDNSKDEKLRQQVHADLEPMHESWKQMKELREQNRALRPELKAALDAKDTKKVKEMFTQLEANSKQQQKLVQSVQTTLRAEVKKVQGLTKK